MVCKDKIKTFLTMYKASNSDGVIRNDTVDAAAISDAWVDFHLHPYLLGGPYLLIWIPSQTSHIPKSAMNNFFIPIQILKLWVVLELCSPLTAYVNSCNEMVVISLIHLLFKHIGILKIIFKNSIFWLNSQTRDIRPTTSASPRPGPVMPIG